MAYGQNAPSCDPLIDFLGPLLVCMFFNAVRSTTHFQFSFKSFRYLGTLHVDLSTKLGKKINGNFKWHFIYKK